MNSPNAPENPLASSPTPPAPGGSVVRRNAVWAAGAAAIMLWYGLGEWVIEEGAYGERLLIYTLQVGGGLMALSALLSLTGARFALLFDAAASVAIGVALLASAALIYTHMPKQSLLNVLFGVVFLHSGFRNWQDYRALVPATTSGIESDGVAV